ncbi:hypothetical protein [Schleiferilactobacillus shenzhenensis]|uniref:hypothetical protein n=1 Tax=Schleiferilactobacillus shenzhenensis TaxID=1231337 RepID=UPI000590DF8B|nr:hypothetical protein [Schleiferilactobacillus shenzhenensis]
MKRWLVSLFAAAVWLIWAVVPVQAAGPVVQDHLGILTDADRSHIDSINDDLANASGHNQLWVFILDQNDAEDITGGTAFLNRTEAATTASDLVEDHLGKMADPDEEDRINVLLVYPQNGGYRFAFVPAAAGPPDFSVHYTQAALPQNGATRGHVMSWVNAMGQLILRKADAGFTGFLWGSVIGWIESMIAAWTFILAVAAIRNHFRRHPLFLGNDSTGFDEGYMMGQFMNDDHRE